MQGLPVLVVVLLGGFTTNAVWCAYLIVRNAGARKPGSEVESRQARARRRHSGRNFLLCALGGTAWYLQFFFYTMGESQMGRYAFSSWTLHMSSIIIFATLWGLALKVWKGASARSFVVMTAGLIILIGATVVIGLGNMLVVLG